MINSTADLLRDTPSLLFVRLRVDRDVLGLHCMRTATRTTALLESSVVHEHGEAPYLASADDLLSTFQFSLDRYSIHGHELMLIQIECKQPLCTVGAIAANALDVVLLNQCWRSQERRGCRR